MNPSGSWETQYRDEVGPRIAGVVLAAQVTATRESDTYAADVLNELDFGPPTEPGVLRQNSLAGVAGDGRSAETLLATTVGRARALSATMPPEQALNDAQAFMDMVTETLIADAARAAEEVAMAERPWVAGYVRMINPPCCSRCALLSGKFYLMSAGFQRHPRCDCYHLPAPEDPVKVRELIDINSPERYFESLSKAEQNRVFTVAGAEAIREGADIGQVVNARRGMSSAQAADGSKRIAMVDVYGQRTYVTTEGTTRRGFAYTRLVTDRGSDQRRTVNGRRQRVASTTAVRLMPETILAIAGDDPQERRRLLKLHGYLL